MKRLELGARVWLAITLPWRVLFDAVYAAKVTALELQGDAAKPIAEPITISEAVPEIAQERDQSAALQLLAILQREGRFIDFLQEDVSAFSDEDIGAAARVVHDGCKRGLNDCLTLAPIREESEGDAIDLAEGFDAQRNRVTGKVLGDPPYRGNLAHPGWQATAIGLPALAEGHDPTVIAAAEIEL